MIHMTTNQRDNKSTVEGQTSQSPFVITGQPLPGGVPYYEATDQNFQSFPRLRITAIVLSAISCCCGMWLCSGPALLLALLPECVNRVNYRAMYISSIALAVVAIVISVVIGLIILIMVFAVFGANKSSSP